MVRVSEVIRLRAATAALILLGQPSLGLTDSTIWETVDGHRARCDYEAAGAILREFAMQAMPEGVPAKADSTLAEATLKEIEAVLRLPPAARKGICAGDSLTKDIYDSFGRGDVQTSLKLATRQLALRDSLLGATISTSQSSHDVGFLFYNLQKYDEAQSPLRSAIETRVRLLGADHPLVGYTANLLHSCAVRLGQYAAAEALGLQALAIQTRVGARSAIAVDLHNLGTLYLEMGDPYRAERYERRAIQLLGTPKDNAETQHLGSFHASLARALADQRGRLGEAEAACGLSLKLHRQFPGPESRAVAINLAILGNIYLRQDRLNVARDTLLSALQTANLGVTSSALHARLADVYLALGDWRQAAAHCSRAIDIHHRHRTNAEEISRIYNRLAQIHIAEGSIDSAKVALQLAIKYFEHGRAELQPGVAQATFSQSPYATSAVAALAAEDHLAAWSSIETDLGRLLSHGLEQGVNFLHDVAQADSVEAASVISIKTSNNRAVAAEVAERLSHQPPPHASTQEQPKLEDARCVQQLDRIQSHLQRDQAVVGWFDYANQSWTESWVYVIRNKGPIHWEALSRTEAALEPVEVDDPLRRLRVEIRRPSQLTAGTDRAAFAAWEQRLEPIEPLLEGITTLIIVPGRGVLGVPIETLRDRNGKLVGERFDVVYAPAARFVPAYSRRSSNPPKHVLLVASSHPNPAAAAKSPLKLSIERRRSLLRGDETTLGEFQPLRWVHTEVSSLKSLFAAVNTLEGERATEASVRRLAKGGQLTRYNVIHVAAHAFADDYEAARSGILLRDYIQREDPPKFYELVSANDGIVSALEIAKEWKLDADLVTLSACETAAGAKVAHEGYVGLPHALFRAGARNVVASLWAVDDRATSLLMRKFYERWVQANTGEEQSTTYSLARALRAAKQWLRNYRDSNGLRPYTHPYYWAGFVLTSIGGAGTPTLE